MKMGENKSLAVSGRNWERASALHLDGFESCFSFEQPK